MFNEKSERTIKIIVEKYCRLQENIVLIHAIVVEEPRVYSSRHSP